MKATCFTINHIFPCCGQNVSVGFGWFNVGSQQSGAENTFDLRFHATTRSVNDNTAELSELLNIYIKHRNTSNQKLKFWPYLAKLCSLLLCFNIFLRYTYRIISLRIWQFQRLLFEVFKHNLKSLISTDILLYILSSINKSIGIIIFKIYTFSVTCSWYIISDDLRIFPIGIKNSTMKRFYSDYNIHGIWCMYIMNVYIYTLLLLMHILCIMILYII